MKDVLSAVARAALEGFCANVLLPVWLGLIVFKEMVQEAMRHDRDHA